MALKQTLVELLTKTVKVNASDLHLCTGYPPTLRVDGVLTQLAGPALSEDDLVGFVAEVLPGTDPDRWREDPAASAQLTHEGPGGARFITMAHKHLGGTGISMRLLPSDVPTPEQLGVPSGLVERLCNSPCGLVLVSGPSGSGKSTTLYSLVEHINATYAAHIICIASPLEYVLTPKRSMVRLIEVGANMPTFAAAARAALRLDPDVIVISEMRDLETVQLAITLAETGHLVFTTIHCETAPEAVARVVDVFPAAQQAFIAKQLAATVVGVIAQRLLRRASGKGRVAAQEVLLPSLAVRELITERRFAEIAGVMAESGDEGMRTMRQHLRQLAESGEVTPQEAARFLHPPGG